MAEQKKKYLDLNGLGYAIRKMDEKKANIESPVFTGTPMAPTPDTGDSSTKLATTEFVSNEFVKKTDKIEESEIEGIFGEPAEAPQYAMKATVDALMAQIENLTNIINAMDYEARIAELERKTADIEVE